jgi:hypothetical protein
MIMIRKSFLMIAPDVACGSHANDWDFDSEHDADAAYNYGDDSRLDGFC